MIGGKRGRRKNIKFYYANEIILKKGEIFIKTISHKLFKKKC